MKLVFATRAWEDYLHWVDADRNVLERLNALIEECRRTPFSGTGRPEPLKGDLSGWWSRRITLQDRLVYRVAGKPPHQSLEIAQCRYHY
ncbi:addiction module toxin [Azorhizobium caulinodans ORS 571]|uniref:Putative mRNA interferase YoeB n=1 Tax=Azorhizobium caulinodans (strain ATCC 43989 / DSM 5975 / JCM 20966 / LMG 6465 / NBRC 14845 / NCIMB 13405 / ORS 571) TaxID=438753 RepID=A8IME9_AZOC5|nr:MULTISPECIES: Txe/YoeB family addiction module toxin [Azorhizobium]TDT96447.1 toxin YoeB [Azorhizobium sp. AG788]BAF86537.1 addiction module toxin [Azorhizobium caulinodans ORS 571]